jgi:hypothetical protein
MKAAVAGGRHASDGTEDVGRAKSCSMFLFSRCGEGNHASSFVTECVGTDHVQLPSRSP